MLLFFKNYSLAKVTYTYTNSQKDNIRKRLVRVEIRDKPLFRKSLDHSLKSYEDFLITGDFNVIQRWKLFKINTNVKI